MDWLTPTEVRSREGGALEASLRRVLRKHMAKCAKKRLAARGTSSAMDRLLAREMDAIHRARRDGLLRWVRGTA